MRFFSARRLRSGCYHGSKHPLALPERAEAAFRARVRAGLRDAVREGIRGHLVEIELVALDVLHNDARLVVVIGTQ